MDLDWLGNLWPLLALFFLLLRKRKDKKKFEPSSPRKVPVGPSKEPEEQFRRAYDPIEPK